MNFGFCVTENVVLKIPENLKSRDSQGFLYSGSDLQDGNLNKLLIESFADAVDL